MNKNTRNSVIKLLMAYRSMMETLDQIEKVGIELYAFDEVSNGMVETAFDLLGLPPDRTVEDPVGGFCRDGFDMDLCDVPANSREAMEAFVDKVLIEISNMRKEVPYWFDRLDN